MTNSPGAQAEAVVNLVRSVFGTDVVGVYLHGSAVLEGLRAYSDLDLLVVLSRRITEPERRSLVAGLLEISAPYPPVAAARPIELTVVVQPEVRPWRYPASCEFQYGEWLRDEFERGMATAPHPSPDLAAVLTMVLDGDAAVFGPPPRDVLDPVPENDLRKGIASGVPGLLDKLDDDTRNVVLTLARVWTTLATCRIHSKNAAADWALEHLPPEHRPVLARAQAVYLGNEPERWDDLRLETHAYAEYVRHRIEHLTAGSE
jgi:predicted nucleotidyltransferase